MSYDLYIAGTAGADSKPMCFPFVSAVACSGLRKVVVRWLKCVLTPQGSDPFSPNEGTDFANLIGSNITNAQDVIDAVTLAFSDAAEQMQAWDRANAPIPAEQFQSATITQVRELTDGGYAVWVVVRNAAGDRLNVELPAVAG